MPATRTKDPGTSHAAAASIDTTKLRASQARVLAMFRLYQRMNDKQLLAYLHEAERQAGLPPMSPSGVRTRRAELVRLGYLRDSGRRQKVDGYNCVVWELN